MSVAGGLAEAPAGTGEPNASQGPTAFERGYAQGQHDQHVADHEALVKEDPVYELGKFVAGLPESLIEKGAEAIHDLLERWR